MPRRAALREGVPARRRRPRDRGHERGRQDRQAGQWTWRSWSLNEQCQVMGPAVPAPQQTCRAVGLVGPAVRLPRCLLATPSSMVRKHPHRLRPIRSLPWGVRVEDTVVVGADGPAVLTSYPRTLEM